MSDTGTHMILLHTWCKRYDTVTAKRRVKLFGIPLWTHTTQKKVEIFDDCPTMQTSVPAANIKLCVQNDDVPYTGVLLTDGSELTVLEPVVDIIRACNRH